MRLFVYVHGRGGSAEDAARYGALFPESHVIGFDYMADKPWEAEMEFPVFFRGCRSGYDSVSVIAESIGAFLAMSSLDASLVDRAYLISPVVSMEKLIIGMMRHDGISEKELSERHEILAESGEMLLWEYLCYVRDNPIQWNVPSSILYGENDGLTSYEDISAFAAEAGAELTVMRGGEHWFHTESELDFLDRWLIRSAM